MEQRHDHQGLVLGTKFIGCDDVGKTGSQIALVQWNTLHQPESMMAVHLE